MNRIFLLTTLLLCAAAVSAQQGSPLLTHFIESREAENQSWAICQDENKVMLFANRKGIITFDGQEWETIRIATIPFTMKKNPWDKTIYIGGDNNFGYIAPDENDNYTYTSLSGDSAETGLITRIVFEDSLAWFCSDQKLIRFNLNTKIKELVLSAKPGLPFTGIFIRGDNTFINVLSEGLYRLESDTLFPIVTGYLTADVEILFCLPYNKSRVLTGRSDGTLALFDGVKYYDYTIRDDNYISDNVLSEGIALGDTAYAFSTLDGGAVVVGKTSGKLLQIINNQSELPDDEIYATGSDESGGLWLSHQYGLTRADLSLPIENYTIFPGLKGNLTSAVRYNNELYVATSEGVFFLSEVKNYSEVQVLIKESKTAGDDAGTGQQTGTARKSIFNKIFGRKAEQQKSTETASPERTSQRKAVAKPAVTYASKTVSRLKSINYIYKKVEGLNEKCRQLVATPYGILSATNKGLYVINAYKATPVIEGRYINYISWQPVNGRYFIASGEGCLVVRNTGGRWSFEQIDVVNDAPVYSITNEGNQVIWTGGDNTATRLEFGDGLNINDKKQYTIDKEFTDRYYVRQVNDTIFLFTESEIHFFNKAAGKLEHYRSGRSISAQQPYLMPLSNYPLLKQDNKWFSLDNTVDIREGQELALLKVFDNVVFAGIEKNNLWVVDGNNRIFRIDRLRTSKVNPETEILIKNISNNKGVQFNLKDVKFDRGDNIINFEIVAPSYIKQNTTQYQYIISRIMSDWSPWSVNTSYDKLIGKPGDYTLQVRARDIWGNVGDPVSLKFTIRAPFTETLFFFILVSVVGLALIISIIRFREKALQQKNRLLEEKVRERTAEIEAQKEEITASIEYAGRIQRAMLPMEIHFKESFSDYFIFFKPRDIVSGDFFWIGEDEKSVFFTVADCTGHGVPGAFMSTMGISILNEIIANNNDLQANTVLNLLREKTMRALHQTGKEGEAADGMDIAFCVLSKDRKRLQFAGAFNPMIIFQGGEYKEYRADRMPIGIHYGDEKSFTNYLIPVTHGDTIYIFSDGYTDQFGGPDSTKYKMANFRNLLKDIYYRPMVEQRNILENEFQKWRGNLDQVDDITIIGVRI